MLCTYFYFSLFLCLFSTELATELTSRNRIKSLLFTLGPFLLPKLIGWYRAHRASAAANAHLLPVIPLSRPAQRAIGLLVLAAAALLVRALVPGFAPENVFVATQSRLQIPVDVLFNRLASLRPLTPADEVLRARFVNLESRLLYLQYGPDALADCPFCSSDDNSSSLYFYYALPALLAPHLVNLFVVSVATSPGLLKLYGGGGSAKGGAGRPWRGIAAMAAGALAVLDIYAVQSYNAKANARATRLTELDAFFWRARATRLASLAALDLAFAALVYLSATNRAFAQPPGPARRAAAVTQRLLAAKAKLGAGGVVRNTVLRDPDLRARLVAYWTHEVDCMRRAREDPDVLAGVNDALTSRIRIQDIERDAERYALGMLPRVDGEGEGGGGGGDEEGGGAAAADRAGADAPVEVKETIVG